MPVQGCALPYFTHGIQRWVGSHSRSGRLEYKLQVWPAPGMEAESLCPPARELDTIPTELFAAQLIHALDLFQTPPNVCELRWHKCCTEHAKYIYVACHRASSLWCKGFSNTSLRAEQSVCRDDLKIHTPFKSSTSCCIRYIFYSPLSIFQRNSHDYIIP